MTGPIGCCHLCGVKHVTECPKASIVSAPEKTCYFCSRPLSVCVGSHTCSLKKLQMQRKDDREREKNRSITLPVEKPELQFATRSDIPTHDASGRALDPVTGKLAREHQTARASELREQEPLAVSDFDPDFESH